MRIPASKFRGVGAGVGVWCAVGIAFHGDGRHGDHRCLREPLFQIVVARLTLGQAEPPAVVMDSNGDVVRIIERRRAAVEGGVIEAPLGRRDLPDELGEVVRVFLIADTASLGGEVELVPPLQLRGRRQRLLARLLVADQIAAH